MTDNNVPFIDLSAAITAECAKYGHMILLDDDSCECGYTLTKEFQTNLYCIVVYSPNWTVLTAEGTTSKDINDARIFDSLDAADAVGATLNHDWETTLFTKKS